MLITGKPTPRFWKILILVLVSLVAVVFLIAFWPNGAGAATPHTCLIPTPDSLYGGFRSPYPSAPFCGGR